MSARYTWCQPATDFFLYVIVAIARRIWRFVLNHTYQLGHLLYFVVAAQISALVLFFGGGDKKISYVNAFYLATSALCNVGLSPVNLGSVSTFQQATVTVTMLIGDAILVTLFIIRIKQKRVRLEKLRRIRPVSQQFCVEERALEILMWRIILDAVITMALGFALMAVGVSYTKAGFIIRTVQLSVLNIIWWAFVNVVSCFTNTGLDLVNKSMTPLNRNYFVLFVSAFQVMKGKTFWPISMRCQLWLEWKLYARFAPGSETEVALRYILDNPRHCHPLLFPPHATRYLLAAQITFTMLAWVCWFVLQVNQDGVIDDMPMSQFAVVGLVQSIMLRSAGMALVTITETATVLQVFCSFYSLISVYPFKMVLQMTEDLEARALRHGQEVEDPGFRSYNAHVFDHFTSRLGHDLAVLVVAILIILRLQKDMAMADSFPVMFEILSAFTNNGLSLGLQHEDYSLSGSWNDAQQYVLCIVMLWGRHRALPSRIDTDKHLEDWPLREPLLRGEGQDSRDEVADEESTDSTELEALNGHGRRLQRRNTQ